MIILKKEVIMPGFDRRGPNGEGSMTGRKMGRCNPENRTNQFLKLKPRITPYALEGEEEWEEDENLVKV